MLNYTDAVAALMQDIVGRVGPLGFIDLSHVLVFARFGRMDAKGAYATCHSLNLPTSEPRYFFWRDRMTRAVTRRSEWFVTKSPEVVIGGRRIDYLISIVLPRFSNQTLLKAAKHDRYDGAQWLAKLDTIIHELYHINPEDPGIRVMEGSEHTGRCHTPEFFELVAGLARQYLDSGPDPGVYEFLTHDFETLIERHGGVCATTFRRYPSFPQRYHERLDEQPAEPLVITVPLDPHDRQVRYSEDDLETRVFTTTGARRVTRETAGEAVTAR
jgi:hypothetical protein